MPTATQKTRQTTRPAPLAVRGLFSANGSAADVAPAPMPEGTGDLPWPAFAKAVIAYNSGTKKTAAIVGFCGLLAMLVLWTMLPLNQLAAAALVVAGGCVFVAVALCKRAAVKPVLILRLDSDGGAYLDLTEWWRNVEAGFPDAWKWPYRGGRLLFLDALDPAGVVPIDPWAAAVPAGEGAPSPTDIAMAVLESKALAEALRVESGMAEIVKAALYIALAGGGVLAMYLAGQRGLEILGYGA